MKCLKMFNAVAYSRTERIGDCATATFNRAAFSGDLTVFGRPIPLGLFIEPGATKFSFRKITLTLEVIVKIRVNDTFGSPGNYHRENLHRIYTPLHLPGHFSEFQKGISCRNTNFHTMKQGIHSKFSQEAHDVYPAVLNKYACSCSSNFTTASNAVAIPLSTYFLLGYNWSYK